MPLTAETLITLSEGIAVADLGDEAVILDPSSGTYFGLNEVATRILALAAEPIALGEMVDRLVEEFDVSRSVLARDVSAFVQDLSRRGLVRVS